MIEKATEVNKFCSVAKTNHYFVIGMEEESASLVAQFLTVDGELKGPQVYLPVDTTPDQLQVLLNNLLENVSGKE